MARAVFGGGLSPYITKAQDRPTPYNPLGALSTAIRQPFVEDVIVPGISRIRDEMRISEQEEQISAQAQERRDAARSAMGKAFFREAQAKMPEVPTMPSLASLSDSAATQANDHYINNLSRELEDMVAQGMPSGALRQKVALMDEVGLGDVAREILQGATAQESLRAAQVAKLKSQLRRQIAAPAPEAVAGPQMLQPSMRGERPLLKNKEQYENQLQRKVDQLATRAYRKHLEEYPRDQEGAIAAATAAAQAAQPEAIAAQEVQAVERPELLEEAAAFREQATALEAEAKGIEGTPVYRTFGDHAMAFLDALDSGDVAAQNALMESVGGSTDYQPFGSGAVGKAIGKDASMRARRDLLDLKKKYLAAQRREKTGLKFIEKRAELRGKKKRTGGRGSGYGKKNDLLLDALVTLNRGDNLTDKQKSQLRRAGGLSESEVSSLTPDRATAWRALTRRVKGKRAESEARDIMRGQATPEEQERAEVRRLEREARDLRAEAKATTDTAEKARLEDRADAKTAAAADAKKAAATRREQRADEKRKLDRIAALQKSLDAVEVTIAGESSAKELEKLQKQKEALEAKIAELTGNLPAKAD